MTPEITLRPKRLVPCLTTLILGLSGCSMTPSFVTQPLSKGAPPLVQNCAIVSISSPTRYACNGKVYTSFELAKLREEWQAKQQAGSGTATQVPTKG
jgi:hypothetical protein